MTHPALHSVQHNIGTISLCTTTNINTGRIFQTRIDLYTGEAAEILIDKDQIFHWNHSFTRRQHSILRSKMHRDDLYQFMVDPNMPLLSYERWSTPPHGKDHRRYWILTRDPNMNRIFKGSEMICDPYPAGHQQDTALSGFQCVVTPAEQRHLLIETYKDWIQT